MANTDNCEQSFVIMSKPEKNTAQTGTTAVCHLDFSGICVGKKQGLLQSFGDLQKWNTYHEKYFKILIYEDWNDHCFIFPYSEGWQKESRIGW